MVVALWPAERLESGVAGVGGCRGKHKSNMALCCIVFIAIHLSRSNSSGVCQETESGGAVGAGNVTLICEKVSYKIQ